MVNPHAQPHQCPYCKSALEISLHADYELEGGKPRRLENKSEGACPNCGEKLNVLIGHPQYGNWINERDVELDDYNNVDLDGLEGDFNGMGMSARNDDLEFAESDWIPTTNE